MTHQSKRYFSRRFTPSMAVLFIVLMASGYAPQKSQASGIGETVAWSALTNWHDNDHRPAWPALLNNCIALKQNPLWKPICADAKKIKQPNSQQIKDFFQQWFIPHQIYGQTDNTEGLITGYYEPLLYGSRTRHGDYQYPLYQPPTNLLKKKPFYTRQQIESDRTLLAGNELVWLNSRDDAFFLHVQGSGRIQMDDGRILRAGYAGNNGHSYVSIGRILKQRQQLKAENISLFTIRDWLTSHPDEAEDLLNENPRYIFFSLSDTAGEDVVANPVGSLNVPLTAQRSIAIDPKFLPLGTPVWLQTYYPDNYLDKANQPLRQLVIAQDTGAAIKGELRADLFWGHGKHAEIAAGNMKSKGTMIALLPKRRQ